ncbi:MAG: NAD(P)H-hydrate dehydratase [Sedimentisphaerales bacterium]|nr:NAD(P)H-hydrate dehydratase [Sedimentisphaerales bacterium]
MQTITQIPELPKRAKDGHKGLFGKVCVVGGSIGMTGAPALAGKAALRSGAGLVRIAIPKDALPIVASLDPCYTTIPLPQDDSGQISSGASPILIDLAADNDVLAFGPGTGTNKGVRDVLNTVISQPNKTVVIDADGLNCLAKSPEWVSRKQASVILTPHPGEMKKLWTSLLREPLPTDRTAQAVILAEKTKSTVVLKGHETVVTDSQKIYINTTGNPGMATAGSGDVLTGIISALIGQGLDNFDASVLGVYIHGLAGNLAAEQKGQVSLIAIDIIDLLCQAFMKHAEH